MNRKRELEKRKLELIRNIQTCENWKKITSEFVKDLNKKYHERIISYEDYTDKISKVKNTETIEKWKHNDKLIENYKKQLETCSRKISEERTPSPLIPVIMVMLVLLVVGFGSWILFLNPESSGTGFSVYSPKETFDMNIYFNVSSFIPNSSIVEIIIDNKEKSLPITYFIEDLESINIDNRTLYGFNQSEIYIDSSLFNIKLPSKQGTYQALSRIKNDDEIISENITEIIIEDKTANVYSDDLSLSEEIIQGDAEANKPVNWTKKISLDDNTKDVEIKIPKGASKIKASKLSGNSLKEIDDKNIKIKEGDEFVALPNSFESSEETEILIEDTLKEAEIYYTTEAPSMSEENISTNKKQVTISSEINYTNITVQTAITETEKNRIKIYWIQGTEKNAVDKINYLDTNNNGLIDRVEWVVPHLSTQIYEIIIEISNAEHLDENREFISNIYDEVKSLDNNWSEPIYTNEYVKITFERNLSSKNDITIYPRNTLGLNTYIEVYIHNSSEKITEFPVITEEKYYKVYLTGMSGLHDTFDLKIINTDDDSAYLEFDHIIDPQAGPSDATILRPQKCARQTKQNSQNVFDGMCAGAYPSSTCSSSNDRISCDDTASESAQTNFNQYGGINGTYFNTSITNCASIQDVFVCYKFWGSNSQHTCTIGADADAGASWTEKSVNCNSMEPASISCANITAEESWTCGSFFGPSGTRSLAKSQAVKSGFGDTTWTFDVLFFNVTYTETDVTEPSWSNAVINETTVYNNTEVEFNTTWDDGVGLSAYVFSINQTGSFVNDSITSFTGTTNTSTNITRITASPGTTVEWRYYANDTSGNANVTSLQSFVVGNRNPVINSISSISTQSIVEAGINNVTFSILVSDADGRGDINSVNASFNKEGETSLLNSSCNFVSGINATQSNYTCSVGVPWFTVSGVWSVNTSANDTSNAVTSSFNTSFTLNPTTAFQIGPNALTWPGLTSGIINQLSNNDPILLNNTGNVNISTNNINITAINLIGEQNSSQSIPAANFSSNINDACEGNILANNSAVSITSSLLPSGNYTVNTGDETSGQEQIYFCLEDVPILSAQAYSTLTGGSWTIEIV